MIDHLFMSVTANGQMTVHLVQHAAGKSDGDLAGGGGARVREVSEGSASRWIRGARGRSASSTGTLSV